MAGKDLTRLAAGLLIGAVLAFPAGMMVARREARPQVRSASPIGAATRAVYSPKVLTDPYFLDRQRANVAVLEQHCRQTGELCAEARQARRWLEEHGAQ
jgi:hypothetical protein